VWQYLNVSANNIGNAGAYALAKMLRHNNTVTHARLTSSTRRRALICCVVDGVMGGGWIGGL
jgi:hypothetical protein